MGKGKKEYGKASSTASICGSSVVSLSDSTFEPEELEPDVWADTVELLYEKRGATRETALNRFVTLFKSEWQFEEAGLRTTELSSLFLASMKRGGSEGVLAAKAYALLATTLGMMDSAEGLYHDSLPTLEPVLKTGKNAAFLAAAIETTTVGCFVGAEDPRETIRVMRMLQAVLTRSKVATVQTAALKGWGLLFTTLSAGQLSPDFVDEQLQVLGELLHAESIEVRGAAGEGLALLFDACDLANIRMGTAHNNENNNDDDEDEDGEHDGLDDIVNRMRDLASNKGDDTRRNKRERGTQKKAFRELCATVEDQEVPSQKVKLRHGDILEVDTLPDNVRLNYIRAFLADGFQAHLQSNSLLHQIFNFRPRVEAAEKLTAAEKRMYRSPASFASKDRSKSRSEQRRQSSNYKSSMLLYD